MLDKLIVLLQVTE